MSELSRPLVVVGDVHLSRQRGSALERDLVRLIDAHPDAEIVFAGDSFDLSRVASASNVSAELASLLQERPMLQSSLAAHLARGAPLTLLAGNHDAPLMTEPCRRVVLDWLGLSERAPLRLDAWFVRRGAVHVEHGHLWDPDNAPSHPLALWSGSTEPLGIALTRRFLVPSGAWEFAHAYDTTPLAGLLGTFRRHGPRAPRIVRQYYTTAIALWLAAGRRDEVDLERLAGARDVEGYAAAAGVEPELVHQLLACAPPPRHHDRRETFRRLYLDRSGATALLVVGTLSVNPIGAALAGAAAGFLAWSLREGISRYADEPILRLEHGAELIRDLTRAEQVILAHTHQAREGRYANTGTFGYARGGPRPYVWVDRDGRAQQRWLAAAEAA